MVLNNEPIFESCLIKTAKTKPTDNFIKQPNNGFLEINNNNIESVKNLTLDKNEDKDKNQKKLSKIHFRK